MKKKECSTRPYNNDFMLYKETFSVSSDLSGQLALDNMTEDDL